MRRRRKEEGLTQEALALLAGVGRRAVWDLERGKPTMRLDVVDAILAPFGKRLGIVDAPRPTLDRPTGQAPSSPDPPEDDA